MLRFLMFILIIFWTFRFDVSENLGCVEPFGSVEDWIVVLPFRKIDLSHKCD